MLSGVQVSVESQGALPPQARIVVTLIALYLLMLSKAVRTSGSVSPVLLYPVYSRIALVLKTDLQINSW